MPIHFQEHKSFIKIDADVNMCPRTPPPCFMTPVPENIDMCSGTHPPHSMTPVPESASIVADSVLSDNAGGGSNPTSWGEYDLIASSFIIEYYLLGLQSFLTSEVCTSLTTYHICTLLGLAFAHGNRQGYTTIPMVFNDTIQPSKILLYYTDNKGRLVKQYRLLSELKPTSLSTVKREVIVLDGTHKGCIVTIHKLKK